MYMNTNIQMHIQLKSNESQLKAKSLSFLKNLLILFVISN